MLSHLCLSHVIEFDWQWWLFNDEDNNFHDPTLHHDINYMFCYCFD